MGPVGVTTSDYSQADDGRRDPVTTTALIIGGGATGLLASILLARNGIDSIVVERHEQRLGQPKAHAINPRSLEILKQAGIDTIALRGMGMSPNDGDMVRFATSLDGLEFGSLPYERQGDDTKAITPEPLFNISQPVFEQALTEAVETYKMCSLKKLAQFNATYPCEEEDGAQKRWDSSIFDKKSNKDFIIRSKYILICDGASSTSRAKFGIPFSIMPGHSAEVFHNVSIHFDADLRHFKSGTLWFFMRESQRGTMICYNRQDSWVYVVRRQPEDEPTSLFTEGYCRSMIDDAIGQIVPYNVLSITHWTTMPQVAEYYRSVAVPEAFILGDAAHAFPPTGGLGLNTGIADAHNLAWKMRAVEAGWSSPRILDSYDRERRPIAIANGHQSQINLRNLHELLARTFAPEATDDQLMNDVKIHRLLRSAIEKNRDHFDSINLQIGTFQVALPSTDSHLVFASSVLALRGSTVQEQPLVDKKTGCIFCWNGEAWKIGGKNVFGNDSKEVFSLLLSASCSPEPATSREISRALSDIAGPFAFVFYNALTSTIYYGRDRLGRRSLLIDTSSIRLQSLTLASAATRMSPSVSEVTTDVIHSVSLATGNFELDRVAWQPSSFLLNKSLASGLIVPGSPSPASREKLRIYLTDALQLRVRDIPDHSHCQISTGAAKVAVLFSGGLDCTLLARITHSLLPLDEAIDLINVAFENPRSMAARTGPPVSPYELCPDRVTGRSSYNELTQVCPERNWRFVAVNVPFLEAMSHRTTIVQLMYPHNTEMDFSIAMALYFAARGQVEEGSDFEEPSKSQATRDNYTARVLLSGLGADEIFAGYSRHAAAFARGGFSDLVNELELDFNRIGSRNLGRDDRMMSYWGKEVRYPYLDEDFVHFALDLPVWEKAGFRTGKPIPKQDEATKTADHSDDLEPAKMLLRLLMWDQGMKHAASERKRAIQFGAKTAKMSAGKGKTRGTDLLDFRP
ncbi:hypothetical protein LTR84_001399 [Exophiala bonariae]|uniref:FAD-binding domain-containing protein n=1 Tax=Exophiala bonariae TaxID=1690606 RepID=A0AAV9NF04_9EURO|nr:hypothetical protein LTR84_001399 [Exophiala bonariae]